MIIRNIWHMKLVKTFLKIDLNALNVKLSNVEYAKKILIIKVMIANSINNIKKWKSANFVLKLNVKTKNVL